MVFASADSRSSLSKITSHSVTPMSDAFEKFGMRATTNLVVVLRAARSDISGLPFDLFEQADAIGVCFRSVLRALPVASPHVLSELDRADLDAVSAAQTAFKPEPLGENATRDFLLRHVFRLDPHKSKAMSICSAPCCDVTTAASGSQVTG